MAQFIVRNLEDDVRDKLRELATAKGQSMEQLVRDILRSTAMASPDVPRKLGSWCWEKFAKNPDLGDEPFEVEELRGSIPQPLRFDE